jgi:hypothetical protein
MADPPLLVNRLAGFVEELSDARTFGHPDPLREAFVVIAETQAELTAWWLLARDNGLGKWATPIAATLARRWEPGDPPLDPLLESPFARAVCLDVVLARGPESEVFAAIVPQLTASDVEQMPGAVVGDDLIKDTAICLLEDSRVQIRAATAAVILSSTSKLQPDDTHFGRVWRSAIEEITAPLGLNLALGEEALLERLAQVAPDAYERRLRTVLAAPDEEFDWRNLERFGDSVAVLSHEARARLWREALTTDWRTDVFQLLAHTDADWVEARLEAGEVTAEFVLRTFNGRGKTIPLERAALMLLPRGVDPGHLARTIEYGVQWGETHERIAGYLDRFEAMATSGNPNLRAVGEAGIDWYRPELRNALQRQRQRQVRGGLF